MLIKGAVLDRILKGEVTLAFRRWRRPTVKDGGSLKTAVGVLSIEIVKKTSLQKITENEARQAGYSAREALIEDLSAREGELFKVTLSYFGEDPCIKLRKDDELTEEEFARISQRLQRLDSGSRHGEWTHRILSIISDHPEVRAADLAEKTGHEKSWFKTNVRKLKNLGLTISLEVGYTLSPRGVAVLVRMEVEL